MKALRIAAIAMFIVLSLVTLYFMIQKTQEKEKMFAFYLSWDDSSDTVTNFGDYLVKPAGSLGYAKIGGDGHIYFGNQRIKFLGVNIVGRSAFPDKDTADKVAKRLAKFGINIVRFHHLEAPWESFNILGKIEDGKRKLNTEALDNLDYFISKLKENGIYVDLNLLVSRKFSSQEGLPSEVDKIDWKDQHALGFFDDNVLELEKEYARQLLTHKNPYTKLTYAEDPAVVFVEIINENGLIQSWLGGTVDNLPPVFKEELQRKWNEYLITKYSSTENLSKAWAVAKTQKFEEVLTNGNFKKGVEGWNFEIHDGAQATFEITKENELNVLRVIVLKLGSESWYVQFNYPKLNIVEGQSYKLTFMAKANKEETIYVSLKQAHEPWEALSNAMQIRLTGEWRKYEVTLVASSSDENGRLDITNLGADLATYEFANFSLMPYEGEGLSTNESLENRTVRIVELREFGSKNLKVRNDWIDFLYGLEEDYFNEMYKFLKDELKVKALVIGTIVGCSTPNIMSQLDVVDSHAYWQHPSFPGVPWDPNNWYVVNEPMVNNPVFSTIQSLAFKRVYGKPFTVTEYNHPSPNMYDAETTIMLSTYASLQDWDGIFFFAYDIHKDERIGGYFDISEDPGKMATILMAHNLFIRGDLSPADQTITVSITSEEEKDLIVRGKVHTWALPDAGYFGMKNEAPLIHKTAIVTENSKAFMENLNFSQKISEEEKVFVSDNDQVTWNVTDSALGLLIVNTSRTAAAIGFSSNKLLKFKNVEITPGNSLLDGFSVIGVTVKEGEDLSNFKNLLLIAVGYSGNYGMEVMKYDAKELIAKIDPNLKEIKTFNGRITCSWGNAPTFTEGIEAQIKIRTKENISVYALDNTGRRTKQIPVESEGELKIFKISPEYRTIWYEITAEK